MSSSTRFRKKTRRTGKACRQVRQQDSDSRQEEKARNTAAHRRVRLEDPERR